MKTNKDFDLRNRTTNEVLKIIDKHIKEHEAKRDIDNTKDVIHNMIGFCRTTDIERVCVPLFVKRDMFYRIYREIVKNSKLYQSMELRENDDISKHV